MATKHLAPGQGQASYQGHDGQFFEVHDLLRFFLFFRFWIANSLLVRMRRNEPTFKVVLKSAKPTLLLF
jgi:hypothetical protein